MIALALTIFVSLALALFFVGLFLIQMHEGSGNPRDALLALEEDPVPTPRTFQDPS